MRFLDLLASDAAFAAPADDAEIAAYEDEFGTLPPLLRQLYQRHNGSQDGTLWGSYVWPGLVGLAKQRHTWNELELRSRSEVGHLGGLWNPYWIPMFGDGTRLYAVTTAPCWGLPAGIVLSFDHKGGSQWDVRFANLEEMFEWLAQVAEAGLLGAGAAQDKLDAMAANVSTLHKTIRWDHTTPNTSARFAPEPTPAITPVTVGADVRCKEGAFAYQKGRVTAVNLDGTVCIVVSVFGRDMETQLASTDVEVV